MAASGCNSVFYAIINGFAIIFLGFMASVSSDHGDVRRPRQAGFCFWVGVPRFRAITAITAISSPVHLT